MRVVLGLAVFLVLGMLVVAQGANVDVGNVFLNPNQANQPVAINITGGELIEGMVLTVEIVPNGTGPDFTDVNTVDASFFGNPVFFGNNTGRQPDVDGPSGQFATDQVPYWELRNVTTLEAAPGDPLSLVPVEGLLATAFIDTTSLQSGSWPLLVSGTREDDTLLITREDTNDPQSDIAILPTTLTNGTITIAALGDLTGPDGIPDGTIEADDIDYLAGQTGNPTDPRADLNLDGVIDQDDREVWVTDIKDTFFGDADLDGGVDIIDFNLLALGYENCAGLWGCGDFDGSGNSTIIDFNLLALNFGNGGGSGGSLSVVPEPGALAVIGTGVLCVLGRRGRRC